MNENYKSNNTNFLNRKTSEITRNSTSTFNLANIGTYQIIFQVGIMRKFNY